MVALQNIADEISIKMEAQNRFRKVVIPAAGLGSRLLPATKEIPKEMLPVVIRDGKRIIFEPTLQVIFDQFYSLGLREFCFVVGRGKRAIEDHFAPDWAFLEKVKDSVLRTELESFFEKLEASRIYFVNQTQRKGFGDAVLHSEEFAGDEPLIVNAGDDLVLSKGARHLLDLMKVYSDKNADGVVLVEEVSDPSRYGVVVCESISKRIFAVREIEEKPRNPKSHLAVIAIYAFSPSIFETIRASQPDATGELQLTSAIRMMIEEGKKVYAIKLRRSEVRVDIGNPESYVRALSRGWTLRPSQAKTIFHAVREYDFTRDLPQFPFANGHDACHDNSQDRTGNVREEPVPSRGFSR